MTDTFKFHHKPFTLITNNKEIFDLLSQVEIASEKINYSSRSYIKTEEDEKKIVEIFRYLNLNYIEKVAFEENEGVFIKYSEERPECNCSLCLYNKLRLGELLQTIDKSPLENSQPEIGFRIKHAYTHYKLGNFTEAAHLFKTQYEERKTQKDISTYIICFNLHNLSSIIGHYYWNDRKAKELNEELKQIDLEEVYRECKTFPNKILLEWIHEKKFYKDTFSSMHEKVQSITDHFYGQNSGYNENTRDLMESYLYADNFLNRNYIIYDIYNEFDSLSKLFTEGLLASYGCSEFLDGKLNYLTDTLLIKLVFFGKSEDIKKYCDRYKLKD